MIKKLCLIIAIITSIFNIGACNQFQSEDDILIKLSKPIDIIGTTIEDFEYEKKDWEEKNEIEENDWLYDRISWGVYLENDKIMISQSFYYMHFRFDMDDGYFLSENYGEFGGKLDFISNDGECYTVLECNPKYMFSINDNIYLLEGLTHISMAIGNLYKLCKIDEKWAVEKKVDLGGEPNAYIIDKGNIYIIILAEGHDFSGYQLLCKILKISMTKEDMKIKQLLKIRPVEVNSMVKKDNVLYIGCKGGLTTINLNSKKAQFYTKK